VRRARRDTQDSRLTFAGEETKPGKRRAATNRKLGGSPTGSLDFDFVALRSRTRSFEPTGAPLVPAFAFVMAAGTERRDRRSGLATGQSARAARRRGGCNAAADWPRAVHHRPLYHHRGTYRLSRGRGLVLVGLAKSTRLSFHCFSRKIFPFFSNNKVEAASPLRHFVSR